MKNNFIGISIICLAVCFLIGSWIIAEGLRENAQSVKQVNITPTGQDGEFMPPELLTREELSFYLGISEEEVNQLGPSISGEYTFAGDIPFVKIGNRLYFPKKAIDEWLQNVKPTSIQ